MEGGLAFNRDAAFGYCAFDNSMTANVDGPDVGNGTKIYRYNSCDVASAVNGFVGLVPYRNAGTDNWPAPVD